MLSCAVAEPRAVVRIADFLPHPFGCTSFATLQTHLFRSRGEMPLSFTRFAHWQIHCWHVRSSYPLLNHAPVPFVPFDTLCTGALLA